MVKRKTCKYQQDSYTLARNGDPRGTTESPDNSPEGGGGGSTCWWPFAAMGCFGSASSKQNQGTAGGGGGGDSGEDKVSQKKRSDAITKQLQKDKQVRTNYPLFIEILI